MPYMKFNLVARASCPCVINKA